VRALEEAVKEVENRLLKSLEDFDAKCGEMLNDQHGIESLLRGRLDSVLENARLGMSLKGMLELMDIQKDAKVTFLIAC
jgi:hypothetical protein